MKTCLNCGHTFDRELVTNEYNSCPILHCGGEVVEIDDNILEAIQLLNKKDYPTLYCCSGHSWSSFPYILFDDSVSGYSFDKLPESFLVSTSNDGNITISKSINSESVLERLRLLFDYAIELYKWADNLPYAELVWISFQFNKGEDVPALLKKIETELHIYNLQLSKSSQDPFKIIGAISVAPSRIKSLTKEAKSFAKENKIQVSIEKMD